MIWFTSDPHYWHANVIKFCDRPFKDVDHMNRELIKRYNSRVQPEDICIFVGDFSFGNSEQTKQIVDQLNGTKILIAGNHDKKTCRNKFDVCLEHTEMVIGGHRVTIKHYPLKWPRFSHLRERFQRWVSGKNPPRYLERHPEDKGQLHIHGHTHSPHKFNKNQIHVGVDAWDYYPVSIKQLIKYIQHYKDSENI